jgi:hypothetical protein
MQSRQLPISKVDLTTPWRAAQTIVYEDFCVSRLGVRSKVGGLCSQPSGALAAASAGATLRSLPALARVLIVDDRRYAAYSLAAEIHLASRKTPKSWLPINQNKGN